MDMSYLRMLDRKFAEEERLRREQARRNPPPGVFANVVDCAYEEMLDRLYELTPPETPVDQIEEQAAFFFDMCHHLRSLQ